MTQNYLEQQIQLAQERSTVLWQAVATLSGPSSELAVQALQELSNTLEELFVAAEELQQTQELLATERFNYQELFEFAPDCYLVTDNLGTIQVANQAAVELLNRSKQFLLGKALVNFVAIADRACFREQLDRASSSLQEDTWEIYLQHQDREPFPCEIKVSLLSGSPAQPIRLRWLIRDISSRKQAEAEMLRALEQQKQLHQLKSGLVTMISHELRTPLSTILLSTELLQNYSSRWSAEKQTTHFSRIKKAVLQINRMLEDVLLIGEQEVNHLPFRPSLVDLAAFCRQLFDELQPRLEGKHRLNWTLQPDDLQAYLDPTLLHHILGNLLANAVKYSPDGGEVRLDIARAGDRICFQIQDQGIGIPPADQPHLFDIFYRGSNVGTIPGSGLGLAVVKQCIDSHQGAISVNSRPGQTVFTVTLALAAGPIADSAADYA